MNEKNDPRLSALVRVPLAYLALTLALTYPLVRRFATAIPGDGFDGWQNFWNLWWVKVAVLEQHTQPWFTSLLYAPTGVGLLFHTLNGFNGFTFLPIQLAWGLFPAYNAVVIFSFAMGGLGAYLLARHVLGAGSSRLAAFGAGAILTFSPFHIAHLLGHMQVISLEWVPFFALYLLRTVDEWLDAAPPQRRAGWRNARLAVFFLALVALCDWYYVLYCALLTAVVGVWILARTLGRLAASRIVRTVAAVAGIWLVWAALLSPLLAPMIREAQQSRFMVPDPAQSRTLSADLLAFVMPQEFHPLWGSWAQAQAKSFTASLSEHQVFAGFTVLALAALGLWAGRRRRGQTPSGAIRGIGTRISAERGLWALILAVFVILALGPALHINGRTDLLPGGGEIMLPYAWLVQVVPFMDISRSVSRFDAVVMLALAVLAAAGLNRLAGRGRGGRRIAWATLALIVFEFLPAPYPLSEADTPAWYRTLAADPRPGAVLNLPMNYDRPGYLLYQTVHGKPLSVAYISRDDPRTLTERAPVLQHFRHLEPDIIAFDLAAQGRQVLSDLGVRWAVLDRYKMPGGREREYTEAAAAEIFGGQAPAYQDDRVTVYEVTVPGTIAPYLVLGVGWESFDAASRTRAFTGAAPVIIQAPTAGQSTLRVTLAPESGGLDAPRTDNDYVISVTVQPGPNTVMLRGLDPSQQVIVARLALEP